jgi:WD40 repeat protein
LIQYIEKLNCEHNDLVKEIWQGCFPVAFSQTGQQIWIFDEEGTLFETTLGSENCRHIVERVSPHCQYLQPQNTLSNSSLVMLGQWRDWIKCCSDTGEIIEKSFIEGLDDGEFTSCHYTENGILAIVTYPSHKHARLVLIIRNLHGFELKTVTSLEFGYKPYIPLALIPHSTLAVCPYGPNGNTLILIDYIKRTIIKSYQGHELWVECVCIIKDYDLLVTGAQDRTLRFWQFSTAKLLQTIHIDAISDILWIPKYDSVIALSSGSMGIAFLAWNIASGGIPKLTECTQQDIHYPNSCILTPDQNLLLSGTLPYWFLRGKDSTIKDTIYLWDVEMLTNKD